VEHLREAYRRALEENGYHVRERESFRHAQEVIKPCGVLDDIIAWCKSECKQDWRWQLIEMSTDTRPGRYIFYFDSEQDYFAFYMKWS
jgi:hypothetical protein